MIYSINSKPQDQIDYSKIRKANSNHSDSQDQVCIESKVISVKNEKINRKRSRNDTEEIVQKSSKKRKITKFRCQNNQQKHQREIRKAKPQLIAIKKHKCNLKLKRSSHELICDLCNDDINIGEEMYECNGRKCHDFQTHFECGFEKIVKIAKN